MLTAEERSQRAASGARALNKKLSKAQRRKNASIAGKAGAAARWGNKAQGKSD